MQAVQTKHTRCGVFGAQAQAQAREQEQALELAQRVLELPTHATAAGADGHVNVVIALAEERAGKVKVLKGRRRPEVLLLLLRSARTCQPLLGRARPDEDVDRTALG